MKGNIPTKQKKKRDTCIQQCTRLLLMGMSVVREFETRDPFIFFMFYVFIFVFSFFFIYTPMEVVSPVGMFVYTAAYTLAADVAFFDTCQQNN